MFFKKPVTANGAPTEEKPKFRLRRKHIKKAVITFFYAIIVFATIFSMLAPGMTF